MSKKPAVSIFWFRRDLRLHDNTALAYALDSKYPVLPIFIFDHEILDKLELKQDARVQFIHKELTLIKKKLEENGSSLAIFHDSPIKTFQHLLKTYQVKKVFANRDYEPYTILRDKQITDFIKGQDAEFHSFKDQVVLEGNEVLKQDGTPFKVFTPFKKVWLQKVTKAQLNSTNSENFEKFYECDPYPDISLQDLGFEQSNISIPSKTPDIDIIKAYDEKRDFPAIDGTSRIGIHLRFGTVSIRAMAKMAMEQNETWLNELIWREFYSSILQHFPYVTTKSFYRKCDQIPWRNNDSEFKIWTEGNTGFPIVDAGMRELNETGYMHNRVRMITASFLTKHLLIDWRWGEAYFASKLLDFELASNNGGWQWAAGTGTDAQPYFRVFNPESQTKKFDPELKYIKKWIPELDTKSYPKPMVDHKQARLRAIETYKRAVS